MKRSEINAIMRESLEFLEERRFHLPPFAHWSPDDWRTKGPECAAIVRQQLGWDITDFGSGDFDRCGLFLFTIRNGTLDELKRQGGKVYAEKVLICRPEQLTPAHFHFQKMEDIINRGGGRLVLRFWQADADEGLSPADITLALDGVSRTLSAGEEVVLAPGESVCIPQRVYHDFWAAENAGTVLVGEVSRVNDDRTDNRFLEEAGRFPEIEEDEAPFRLLVGDYPRYYRDASGGAKAGS
jgi:D-lyxose ketol-isomerase